MSDFGRPLEDGTMSRPVMVGDKMNMKILGVGRSGDPFGAHKRLKIFIKNTKAPKIGDTVRVEIIQLKETCAFANVI